MFKLIVLVSTLCALATARPGYLHGPILPYAPVVHAPVVAKTIVLPPAISHSSSTIVHGPAHVVTPVLAPAVKTIYAPAYHPAPLLGPIHGLPLGPHYH